MLQHVMKAHELYIVTTKQVTSLLLSNKLASRRRHNAAAGFLTPYCLAFDKLE